MPFAPFAVLTAVALLVSGCSNADAEDTEAEPTGISIRLVIADGNIREPEVPCQGAGAFRYAHPEAPFVVEDAAGQEVASGSLPQGVSEPAWTLDLGDRRQVTVCVMEIALPGVDTVEDSSLVIDGQAPKPIEPNPNRDDMPEVVLS